MGAGITIVGLGPGNPQLLTREAMEVLQAASEVYLRTRHHPVVDSLPSHLQVRSFDAFYEHAATFEAVYERIVETVLELGQRPEGVIYAVPGHPYVAESTALEITRRGRAAGLPVRLVAGLSFLEVVCTALEIDPFPNLALADALELAVKHVPPFPPSAPALVAQIHSAAVAADVKLTLMSLYPDEHGVYLVHAAGTPTQKVEVLPLYEIDRSPFIGLLTCLYVPPLENEASFEAFLEVVAHLRAPDGCPWDREQTHRSLRSELLSETYEVLTAIDAGDEAALCEELGDLLLLVFMLAQIASDEGAFTIVDVLRGIHTKIVRRHPHVFGHEKVEGSRQVLQNWEKLKAHERAAKGKEEASSLDGVPAALPALVQAQLYQKRAARVGFDWPEISGVWDKVSEELKEAAEAEDETAKATEIGDLLFAVVNLARWYHVDAESALREANARFRRRFGFMEAAARARGRPLETLSLEEWDDLWRQSKEVSS